MFDAIWNIKPRLFGLGGVASLAGRTEPEARPFARHEQPAGAVRVRAQPRDSYGYRCGLRLAQAKNPSVLFVPPDFRTLSTEFPLLRNKNNDLESSGTTLFASWRMPNAIV